MLNCLVGLNRRIIARRKFAPLLASGVRYKRENGEQWQTIAQLYAAGSGDCEDLSAALPKSEMLDVGEEAPQGSYMRGDSASDVC